MSSRAKWKTDVWGLAEPMWQGESGPHVGADVLEQYVRGEIVDSAQVTEIRRHLARCEGCLRKEIQLEQSEATDALVLPLRTLRLLGSMWLGQPVGLAAKEHQLDETRLEYVTSGECRLDARVTPSDALVAALTKASAPVIGWRVRLERIDADGRLVGEEAAAVTDADGRANLGPARRETGVGHTFRVVAEPGD